MQCIFVRGIYGLGQPRKIGQT